MLFFRPSAPGHRRHSGAEQCGGIGHDPDDGASLGKELLDLPGRNPGGDGYHQGLAGKKGARLGQEALHLLARLRQEDQVRPGQNLGRIGLGFDLRGPADFLSLAPSISTAVIREAGIIRLRTHPRTKALPIAPKPNTTSLFCFSCSLLLATL